MNESTPSSSQRLTALVVAAYVALLLVLLLAEFGVGGLAWLRATNQVLLLLALLFLPFLLLAASQAVRSVSLRVSGQELHLDLTELQRSVAGDLRRIESNVAGQLSTAEQSLWPILAGPDPHRDRRWRDGQIVIGSKLDTSQIFLGYLLAAHLERRLPSVTCTLRVPNGGSLKNFADLRFGWIDLYVDYTGTSLQYFNLAHRGKTPATLLSELNAFGTGLGVEWLAPLGASEGFCLVVRRERADREGIRTIRDLSRVSDRLVLSADAEFLNRRDGYAGLRTAYDLAFRRIELCPITHRYTHLESGEADVFIGFETDPELQSQALVVLRDIDEFFPDYHAVPIASRGALDSIEGLREALLELRDSVTTQDLMTIVQKLNRRGSQPAVVKELAREFAGRGSVKA